MGIRIDNLLKIALDREFPLVDTKVPQTYGIVEKSSRQFVLGLRGSEASDDGRKAMQLGSVQFSTAQHRTAVRTVLCFDLSVDSIWQTTTRGSAASGWRRANHFSQDFDALQTCS
jgi:hypothetical protein